jgi:hypothetical protein
MKLRRKLRNISAGCWWFTPVILAMQNAEIRRIAVFKIIPGQIVHETLFQKKKITKKGLAEWLKQ